MAAVAQRNVTTSTLNQATYASTSFTPTEGDLLVVLAMVSGTNTPTFPMCTASANGITFSRLVAADTALGSSADLMFVFVANQMVQSSPASMTVTVDVTGDAGTGAVLFVLALTGMSRYGLDAVVQSAKAQNQAGASAPSVTFGAAAQTGNVIVGFVAEEGVNPIGATPPTNFTEDAGGDTGYATPTIGAEYCYRNSGHTSATVTWGASESIYGVLAVEFDASAGPSGFVPLPKVAGIVQASASTITTASVDATTGGLMLIETGGSLTTATAAPAVSSVVGLGGTWTLVNGAGYVDGVGWRSEVWKGIGCTGSGTIVVTFAAAMTSSQNYNLVEIASGWDTTTPIVQSDANSQAPTATTLTLTLSAFGDAVNNLAMMTAVHRVQEDLAAEAGYALLAPMINRLPAVNVAWEWKAGEDTSPSMSWATSSRGAVGVAFEVKAIVIATGEPPLPMADARMRGHAVLRPAPFAPAGIWPPTLKRKGFG